MTLLLLSQMEEERRKHEPPTETERLQASANSHTRNRADDLLTEQRDEVKHMNQMVQYSKCVTIRSVLTSLRQLPCTYFPCRTILKSTAISSMAISWLVRTECQLA